jgi:hypothetical protein
MFDFFMFYTITSPSFNLYFSNTIFTDAKKCFSENIDVVPKLDYKQNSHWKIQEKKQIIIPHSK